MRYAVSDDAVWGLNIARTIRRKNERTFLVPPPLAYGFSGHLRTSQLATLVGLGRLTEHPRLEITPYVRAGTTRDFEALDTRAQYSVDTGADLKYGITPGITLDASWRTDFAQVEADQEQVNLTRFSLFFPEKRDFLLEGAGIFSFGELVRRSGRRPPTLLFYSRRIGLEEGHAVPVIAGAKVTGRSGPIEIGVLNVTTEAAQFRDEETEDRYVNDVGDLLDAEDPRLASATIVDTVEVDFIDTTRASRAPKPDTTAHSDSTPIFRSSTPPSISGVLPPAPFPLSSRGAKAPATSRSTIAAAFSRAAPPISTSARTSVPRSALSPVKASAASAPTSATGRWSPRSGSAAIRSARNSPI